jgi:hypothetical protein
MPSFTQSVFNDENDRAASASQRRFHDQRDSTACRSPKACVPFLEQQQIMVFE